MEIISDTADNLFNKLREILDNVMYTNIDDAFISKEIVNATLVLTNPCENTMTKCKRDMSLKYAIMEHLWYNSRNCNLTSISRYSKFWNKISDDNKHVNSNYGYCIKDKFGFDQWELCKNLLLRNPNSRQAILHIKEPRDILLNPTKDLNCTICMQFLIRKGKLDLIVTMRSNDIWLGLPYDLFNFTCMQIQMAMELDINVGTYYHNVGSLHLYTKDYEKMYGGDINEVK